MKIPFNRQFIAKNTFEYTNSIINHGDLSSDGYFTKKCEEWIQKEFNCLKAFITPSCTAALEMAALILGIEEGDEIIMPSYTFVSTANAFVLRGAKPVFVDIDKEALNINTSLIENNITNKTRAIVVVHYGGYGCDMSKIKNISRKYSIPIIEDAAQCFLSQYKNQSLGTFGDIGCYSFHYTKNISCGEGGAILINNKELIEKAEIIRAKGTDQKLFKLGIKGKYEWIEKGSSFFISELTAAFLYAQFQESKSITSKRELVWNTYNNSFRTKFKDSKITLPPPGIDRTLNYHMYFLILKKEDNREEIIYSMKRSGVECTSHYQPLHNSTFGKKFERSNLSLPVTEFVASKIIRLPISPLQTKKETNYVIDRILNLVN